MNLYRITIRHGQPHRYHMEDVRAATLADAVRQVADRFPAQVAETGDLLEIRRQMDPEQREYTPG